MNAIEIKADLLCYGLAADKDTIAVFEEQNPNLVWKTGNNGCFFEFAGTRVLASVAHSSNMKSTYMYSAVNKTLTKNGVPVSSSVYATLYPGWYNVKLSTGRSFTEVFLLEGERFFHQAYKGCDFMACNLGCKFCATGLRDKRESTPSEIGEAARTITENFPDAQICLGGGTYLPISENVKYFAECAKAIRKVNEHIPIWIEMVPPSKEDIRLLIDAGATAFGFNIEIWDDETRRVYCPGKSAISKNNYLRSLEYAASILPNKVGSCLIVGLDTEKNIMSGIDVLSNIGVHSCLLPYKPFDGSKLKDVNLVTCKPKEYIDLSYYAVESMHSKNLNLFENQGCLLCECCTIMHDIWRGKNKEVIL